MSKGETTMSADEIAKRLREDARRQESLLHVCDSTRNALEAANLIESLQAQLAEAQRRADAAIKDMECYIGRVLSPKHGNCACCICKHADNDCGMLGRCNGLSHWEWRGPKE
jgi:hypothetical protein